MLIVVQYHCNIVQSLFRPCTWLWSVFDGELRDTFGTVHGSTVFRCTGVYNGVAPQIITNADFTKAFAKSMHRPAFFPTPAFILDGILGSERSSILTKGQRVHPKRVLDAGFGFLFPTIQEACDDICAPDVENYVWHQYGHCSRSMHLAKLSVLALVLLLVTVVVVLFCCCWWLFFSWFLVVTEMTWALRSEPMTKTKYSIFRGKIISFKSFKPLVSNTRPERKLQMITIRTIQEG